MADDLTELETLLATCYPGPYLLEWSSFKQSCILSCVENGSQRQVCVLSADGDDPRIVATAWLMAHSWDLAWLIGELRQKRELVLDLEGKLNRNNPVVEGVLRLCRENRTPNFAQYPTKVRARLQELWTLFSKFEPTT